jgi:hypothetical protein
MVLDVVQLPDLHPQSGRRTSSLTSISIAVHIRHLNGSDFGVEARFGLYSGNGNTGGTEFSNAIDTTSER